jgi:radical SAM superfamily enzyme YgiQ (UPF0313 family)
MKVLLVRPEVPNLFKYANLITSEPIELEYLYTELKTQNHETLIFDGVFEERPFRKILEAFEPDLVAITGYITQEDLMIGYARQAKIHNRNVATIVGGVHVQLNPERFKVMGIDYIFRSESMESFGTLLDALENGLTIPESVNGLIHRCGDRWIENVMVPVEIDKLPIPDRSYFHAHKNRYNYLDLTSVATVKTSFSCQHNCNFCYCTKLGGGVYNARNLDLVIEELSGIDTDNILIVDDDFLADIERAKAFVEKVRATGLEKNYICYARADAVASNPGLIREMAEVGFKYFIVGLEAISDEDLRHYDKKTTEVINRKCIENIQSTNAQIIALMMVSQKATKKDFVELYKWAQKNKLVYTTVSIFTPIPGTALYEEHRDKLISKKNEHWDFLHLVLKPENMTRFQFYFHFIWLSYKLYRLGKNSGGFDFNRKRQKKKR